MNTLNGGRIGIAAQALGIAQGAYERSLDYARLRKAFGTEIVNHQAICDETFNNGHSNRSRKGTLLQGRMVERIRTDRTLKKVPWPNFFVRKWRCR